MKAFRTLALALVAICAAACIKNEPLPNGHWVADDGSEIVITDNKLWEDGLESEYYEEVIRVGDSGTAKVYYSTDWYDWVEGFPTHCIIVDEAKGVIYDAQGLFEFEVCDQDEIDYGQLTAYKRVRRDKILESEGVAPEYSDLLGLWQRSDGSKVLVSPDGIRMLPASEFIKSVKYASLDVLRPKPCKVVENKTKKTLKVCCDHEVYTVTDGKQIESWTKLSDKPADISLFEQREEARRAHPAIGEWCLPDDCNESIRITPDRVCFGISHYDFSGQFTYDLDDDGKLISTEFGYDFCIRKAGDVLRVSIMDYFGNSSSFRMITRAEYDRRQAEKLAAEKRRFESAFDGNSYSCLKFNRAQDIQEKLKISFSANGMGVMGYYVAPYYGQYTSFKAVNMEPFTWESDFDARTVTIRYQDGSSNTFSYDGYSLSEGGDRYTRDY